VWILVDAATDTEARLIACQLARSTGRGSAATALGRYGQPMEAAGAIAALTGPDTSNITSAVINVDGGSWHHLYRGRNVRAGSRGDGGPA
jgi:NAD(P)-dependent dehydrogenase (short-subunit alcohol dehydrogenase family)